MSAPLPPAASHPGLRDGSAPGCVPRVGQRLTPAQASPTSGRVGLVVAMVLLAAVFVFAKMRGSTGSGADGPEAPKTTEELYQGDRRLSTLLGDCGFGGAFEADTTDIPAILVSKLDAGAQLAPQQRARTDLAALGDAAREPLQRLFEAASRDQWRGGVAKNVLAVCALSESDFGVPIAVEALRSPAPEIRGDAAIVIAKHPKKELYEPMRQSLAGFRQTVNIERALRAMYECDPLRFAREIPGWIDEAERKQGYVYSPLLDAATPMVATIEDPETAGLLKDIAQGTEGLLNRHTAYLLAPSARLGDEASLQTIRDFLGSPASLPRFHGLQALRGAGLIDEAYVIVETVDSVAERTTAMNMLLDKGADEGRTEAQINDVVVLARRLLRDDAVEMRETALRGLLGRGDEEAQALLMRLLGGTIDERSMATRAMRDQLDDYPEVADQARAHLIALWDAETTGAQNVDVIISILAALGAVPGEATGQFLCDAATIVGENPIRGTAGYQWVVGQAYNAGPEARQVLRQRIQTETEPLRRIDLIQFIWQDRSKESADVLLDLLENTELSSYERLYAADRLLRMGIPERVLPVMKRVYRTEHEPVLRDGLHCLLWIWFGPALT